MSIWRLEVSTKCAHTNRMQIVSTDFCDHCMLTRICARSLCGGLIQDVPLHPQPGLAPLAHIRHEDELPAPSAGLGAQESSVAHERLQGEAIRP